MFIERTRTVDFSETTLGPSWFRRNPTMTGTVEPGSRVVTGDLTKSTLRGKVIDIVNRAREVLAICSFIIDDKVLLEALNAASQRGARVYVLTPSKKWVSNIDDEDERRLSMSKDYQVMLDRFVEFALLRDAPVHAKFVVADPLTENSSGILSTANFTADAFTHPEIGVVLTPDEADELFRLFAVAWWHLAERELLVKGRLDAARTLSSVPSSSQSLTASVKLWRFTYPAVSSSLRSEIARLAQASKKWLLVVTYGISEEETTFKSVLDAITRGVRVDVLVRPRATTMNALHQLASAGATVRGLDGLHAKAIVSENETSLDAVVMTANLEPISMERGFEVGLPIHDNRINELVSVLGSWWNNAGWEYCVSKELGRFIGEYRSVRDRELTSETVVEHKDEDLGDLQIPDLAMLNDYEPTLPKRTTAHRVTFHWRIRPPSLPDGARRMENNPDGLTFPLWRDEKGTVYVTAGNENQISEATAQAKRIGARVVWSDEANADQTPARS